MEPDELLVRLADKVREHFGAPATVSSGVRCQAHNDELPGSVPNSYHVRGKAMDFCIRGWGAARTLALVRQQHEKARNILLENRAKLDELASFLYEKETITGEEFMTILNQ